MIALARFLTRAFARVEPRHWAGVGASAALHLAVILGWQPAPAPEPEAISFEVTFEPVTPLPVQKTRLAAKKVPVKRIARDSKAKKLASKTPQKQKRERPREAHLLDANWRAEHKPAKDAPELALPDARTLGIQADKLQAAQANVSAQLKPALRSLASAPVQVAAGNTTGASGAELSEPQAASIGAGQAAATLSDGGLALANSTSLSPAQRAGSAAAGAQENSALATLSGGAAAGDSAARNDFSHAVPTRTALQAGNGMPLTSGAEASATSAATQVTAAAAGGAQMPGVRLAASGVLLHSAALPAGAAASLAAPQAATLAQVAFQSSGTGSAPLATTRSASAGQAARPGSRTASAGRGGAMSASPGDSLASRAVRGPESGGRLSVGAAAPARSSAGAAGAAQPGRSGQNAVTVALAPGEPGSSPSLAVTLQPLLANAQPHVGARGHAGRGNAVAPAGGGRESLVGSVRSGMSGGAGAVENQAVSPFAASAIGAGIASAGRPGGSGQTGGGVGVAPLSNVATAVLAAAAGSGRPPVVLHATQPPAVKVVRPDTEIQRLDVLAPSNYCPLPLPGHAQPDNRAPQAQHGVTEQPAYAPDNPGINYPVLANIRGVEGRVTVRVEVRGDGRPGKMWLKQSSGSGILDQDAQAQLKQWRFVPARRNGQPVSAWIDVPVLYRLSQGRP